MSGTSLIVEFDSDQFLAVEARVEGDRVRVVRAVCTPRPAKVGEDAAAVGRWMRETLDRHGFSAKPVIVSVSRGEVMIKRIDLPTEGLSPRERHEAIRMQMSRQAAAGGGEHVVDYMPSDEGRAHAGAVTAAAMPADRVAWRREAARAAGLRLVGIRLRSAGVRAAMARVAERSGPVLVIAPGVGSVEMLVIARGRLVFARSIDAAMPASVDRPTLEAFADRIAVEASRTWMSYRVSPEGEEVERTVVLAAEPLGGVLAAAVEARLELPASVESPGGLVEADEGVDASLLTAALPLAGLLLCKPRGIPVFDFATPTTPPDSRAGLRQGVLAGMLLVIVLGGAGFLFAQGRLREQRSAIEVLKESQKQASDRYVSAMMDGARVGHLRAWMDEEIDWLAHLAHVIELMPGPTEGALSELSLEVAGQVRFKPRAQLNDPGAWSADSALMLRVSGSVRDRSATQRFRQRLLDSGLYTVTSQGAEVEDRFGLQITTAAPTPAERVKETP